MLTAAIVDADWAVRRCAGRGLRRDVIEPDAGDPDAPATFETAVIRLPGSLAARLASVAVAIAAVQPTQYVCPPDTVHVTLCGPIHPPDDAARAVAIADLRDLASRLAGCRLRVVRLTLGDTSVFAAVEASGADFVGVRRELMRRWGIAGRHGPGGVIAGRLLWANLIRFTEPPSSALVEAVGRVRRVHHTGFVPAWIELVRANHAMSAPRTTVLARVEIPSSVEAA